MGYNISILEGRNGGKDWPLIVEAVPCETCGAKEGEKCHNVNVSNPFYTRNIERIDYHATRKQFAAHVWYSGKAEGVPEDDIAQLVAGQRVGPTPDSAPTIAEDAPTKSPEEEIGVVMPPEAPSSVPSGKEESTPTQASAPENSPPLETDAAN